MKRRLKAYFTSNTRTAQFLRFATVGAKMSVIDAGGVYLLHFIFGFNLYLARFCSLGAAIAFGYLLNRYFTFSHAQRGPFFRQMAGHFGVFIFGGLLNYGVFSGVVHIGHQILQTTLALTLLPLIAVWIGGLFGMLFNFTFSKILVFRHGIPHRAPPPRGKSTGTMSSVVPPSEVGVHR